MFDNDPIGGVFSLGRDYHKEGQQLCYHRLQLIN